MFKVTVLDSNRNALAKTDDGSINFLQGGRYDYSVVAKSSNKPKKFAIRTSTIEEVVTDNSGLLTALSFEDVPKLLAQFANEKRKVDVRYNNAIIGGLNVGANLEHLKTQPKMLHKPAVIQKFNQEKLKPNGPLIETFYTAGSESSSLDQLDLTGALDDLMSLGSLGSVASEDGDNLGDSLGSLNLGEDLDALAPETTEGTNLDDMNSFGLDFDDDEDDDDSISNDFNFEKEGTKVGGMDFFSQGLTQSAEEPAPSTTSTEDPTESTQDQDLSTESDINPDFTKFFAEEKPIPDFPAEDDSEEYEINYKDDDDDNNGGSGDNNNPTVEDEVEDKEGSKSSKTMSLF